MGPASLHAPWRESYIASVDEQERKKMHGGAASSGSFLLDYWNDPAGDVSNFVVARGEHGLILLNRFPYANGHLLVSHKEARPTLSDYDAEQRAALWRMVDDAAALMERALRPQGMNIGINQGRAAGAGVPQHLHVHLVPRWSGDVNVLTVLGNVRVIHSPLEQMAARYREVWLKMREEGLVG
jgi:ATP adenylyltransferase